MSMFQVDSEQVALAAANAAQTGEAIRDSVGSMMAQLRALEGAWVGAAAAQFQDVLLRWHMTQVQVDESLAAVASALGRASATYAEAEGAAAAMFAG